MLRRSVVLTCLVSVVASLVTVGAATTSSAQTLVDEYAVLPMSSLGEHVVDEAAGRVYLASAENDSRVVVTDLDGEVLSVIDGLPGTGALALTPDGSSLYVALREDSVVEVDTTTLVVVETFVTPSTFTVTDLAWAGSALWLATDHESGLYDTVYRLDPASGVRTVVLSEQYLPTVAAQGNHLVVRNGVGAGTLTAIDATTSAVTTTRTLADRSTLLDSTSTGDLFVVSQPQNGEALLSVLDPSDLSTVRSTAIPLTGDVVPATANDDLVAARSSTSLLLDVYDADSSQLMTRLQLPTEETVTYRIDQVIMTSQALLTIATAGPRVVLAASPLPVALSTEIDLGSPASGDTVGVETTLTGTLTDAGAPVPGAEVVVSDVPRYDSLPTRTRTVTTNDQGQFSFPYVARSYSDLLTVRYDGSVDHPAASGQFQKWFDYRPAEIALSAPSEVAPSETVEITGMLTSLGDPVGQQVLDVSAAPACAEGLPDTVTTESDGSFRLTADPGHCISALYTVTLPYNNAYETTSATVAIHVSWKRSTLTLTAPTDVTVGTPITWTGQLLIDNAPASEPLRWYITSLSQTLESGELVTAADGTFTLTRTYETTGNRTLTVYYDGDAETLPDSVSRNVSIKLREAQLVMDQSSTTAYPGQSVTIAGTLTSADGAPIAGKQLDVSLGQLSLAPVTTDDDGRFSFARLVEPNSAAPYSRDDVYRVVLPQDDTYAHAEAETVVAVRQVPTNLSVQTSHETTTPGDVVVVSGRLMDPVEGEPVAGAPLSVRVRSSNGWIDDQRSITTNDAGRYRFTVVAGGGVSYDARVQFAGTARLAPVGADAGWQGLALPGVLSVDGPASVLQGKGIIFEGTIKDTSGVGDPTMIDVRIQDSEGNFLDDHAQGLWADDEGRFSLSFPGFAAGLFTVHVTTHTWRTTSESTSFEVRVRPLAFESRALNPVRRADGYAVYDTGTAARISTQATPARRGLCVRYEVLKWVDGRWWFQRLSSCHDTDRTGQSWFRLRGPQEPGRFRLRARFNDTFPVYGNWVKVRFR